MSSKLIPYSPSIPVVDIPGGRGNCPIPLTLINEYSALSIPAYRRAMSFLADNLASFPRSVRKDGVKLDVPHLLDRLLKRRPNQYQNPTAFWRAWFLHAAHTGNGYARIERDAGFRPTAFHNLAPCDVVPFRLDLGDGSGMNQYYYHRPTASVIAGADMLHLQGLSWDGQAGMDPVCLHERTLQRSATLETYQLQYLQGGTMLRGAIEVPGDMDDDQLTTMRAILRRFRGTDAEDDVLILTSGAKLNNATTSPQASQLVEQMAMSTKQIAQVTGVPPEFLFELNEAKYNASIEQSGQNVVRYCLRPWIELAEDELTFKLLAEAEQDQGFTIALNPDALLRGDTKTQTDTVVASVRGGIRSRNEARALLGLPRNEDPESDKLKLSGDTSAGAAKPTENSAAT